MIQDNIFEVKEGLELDIDNIDEKKEGRGK
jgi:hypothetical protein